MSPRKQHATGTGDLLLLLYAVGDQVALADGRSGQVVSIGLRYVHVALPGGQTLKVAPENIVQTLNTEEPS